MIYDRDSQGNHERDCGVAKKVGLGVGEGFQEMDLAEIQELIDTIPEELSEDDLIDTGASKPVPDDEEESVPENS